MHNSTFEMPLWALLPFAFMLLAIAIGPLVAEHWWEKNRNKFIVSMVLGIPTAIYLIAENLTEALAEEIFFDYVPFIVLLLTLFVITGGIHLSGDIRATPKVNTIFLAIGFALASIMGTTGAAMLLIRPVLTTNSERKYKMHTVLFFIALVANCGGLLTPLGDPPLFMLYVRGASFTWFMKMLPEWAFTGCILLTLYYLFDRYYYKKEPKENVQADIEQVTPLHLGGRLNFLLLLGVVLSVAFLNKSYVPAMETGCIFMKFLREIVLLGLMGMSLLMTKRKVRYELNKFSWTPIVEVAVLFIGIFVTMTPALIYLTANASKLGLSETWQFFYSTGTLSSFLDNTPTAVAFHGVAKGLPESLVAAQAGIIDGVSQGIPFVAGVPETFLKAISIGAVFFGSMTYIGNGPNFMVKAIAEESGVKMPSFFAYMLKFSLIILLPVYVLVQLLFL